MPEETNGNKTEFAWIKESLAQLQRENREASQDRSDLASKYQHLDDALRSLAAAIKDWRADDRKRYDDGHADLTRRMAVVEGRVNDQATEWALQRQRNTTMEKTATEQAIEITNLGAQHGAFLQELRSMAEERRTDTALRKQGIIIVTGIGTGIGSIIGGVLYPLVVHLLTNKP